MSTKHNKGKIKDNAYAALVRSDVFKHKVEKSKKGKGSYKRKAKHKGKAPYQKKIS